MKQLFIVLTGISGSGKSSVAENMAAKTGAVIISSDAIRKEMWGDEACQSNPHLVFAELFRRVRVLLGCGHSVIIDSTALTRRRRGELLSLADNTRCHKICCVVYAPLEECIERQQMRARHVPDFAVERQAHQFEKPTTAEGWDQVSWYNNAKQAAV